MGEHRSFRKPGGSGSVLNVDSVVRIERGFSSAQFRVRDTASANQKIIPGNHCLRSMVANKNNLAQFRQLGGMESRSLRLIDFGANLPDRVDIIRVAETLDQYKSATFGLP